MVEDKIDLDTIPKEIRDLLFIEWDIDMAFDETTKKLDKLKTEIKEHRNKIKKLSPEKQVVYWRVLSQYYKGDI